MNVLNRKLPCEHHRIRLPDTLDDPFIRVCPRCDRRWVVIPEPAAYATLRTGRETWKLTFREIRSRAVSGVEP